MPRCGMSERSIYLRDQADKCLRHASAMGDAYTQAELRKLAAEYIYTGDRANEKSKHNVATDRRPAVVSQAANIRAAYE